jgi:hypothetical protein
VLALVAVHDFGWGTNGAHGQPSCLAPWPAATLAPKRPSARASGHPRIRALGARAAGGLGRPRNRAAGSRASGHPGIRASGQSGGQAVRRPAVIARAGSHRQAGQIRWQRTVKRVERNVRSVGDDWQSDPAANRGRRQRPCAGRSSRPGFGGGLWSMAVSRAEKVAQVTAGRSGAAVSPPRKIEYAASGRIAGRSRCKHRDWAVLAGPGH